jgi:hypothetical protein
VVYRVDRGTRGDEEHIAIWRACWRPTGTRTRIPRTYDDVYSAYFKSGIRLAGRFAAIGQGLIDHYGGSTEDIDVYDLARGARSYSIPSAAWTPDFGCSPEVRLDAFALNRRAFLGWATSRWVWGNSCANEPTRTGSAVHVHDSRGSRTVEKGEEAVTGLGITRSRVTWMRDGQAGSAALR